MWLVWSVFGWLLFLVAWIPSVEVVASHHDSRQLVATIAVIFGGLAVIATIAYGTSLGYRRQWGYLAWSILVATATIGLTIFLAFEASVPANAPDDPGVGLGAMLVTAFLVPVVALFLWLGGAIGYAVRRIKA
jgi:hypothetical protein